MVDKLRGHLCYPIDNSSYTTPIRNFGDGQVGGKGACAAIAALWARAMFINPVAVTQQSAEVPLALGSKQQIEKIQSDFEVRGTTNSDALNILKPLGLRVLRRGRTSLSEGDIETFLNLTFATSGSYFLSLSDPSGLAHNLAIYTGVHGYFLLDPNFGLYRAGGKREFLVNAGLLHEEYYLSYDDLEWSYCAIVP